MLVKKKIKVLHLPENIASFISETVSLQNRFSEHVTAKGVIYTDTKYTVVDYNHTEVRQKTNYEIKHKPRWFLFELEQRWKLVKDILWADVIHWYWSDRITKTGFEFKVIKLFRKPVVIEWLGSEIRQHEIECKMNPNYKQLTEFDSSLISLFCNENSLNLQKQFAGLKAIPAMVRGASITYHLEKTYFKKIFTVRHRIDIHKIKPAPTSNAEPLLVHAPTDTDIKGTSYILKAVESLRSKGLRFQFRLIQNLKRSELMELLSECDVYVDQLICGGYGMAATEALCAGKAVVCYLHPMSLSELPEDCPIVNAGPDTIEEMLEQLILNEKLRKEISVKSRAYAERYYAPEAICAELESVYHYVLA